MEKQEDTTFSVIWKYFNTRRNTGVFQGVALEILSFIYEQKVGEKNTSISDFFSSHQYVPGILDKREENLLLDNYIDVVEFFCHENDFGMTRSPEILQPDEITSFAVSLLGLHEGARIYNPFGGYASYAIAAPQYRFFGDELNQVAWAILNLRLTVKGIDAEYIRCDSYKRIPYLGPDFFEGAIATPPLGVREHNELDTAKTILDKLKPEGRVVFISALGPLFRSGRDERFRRSVVDKGLVETIIELPDNLYYGTSVPCAIIVLSKCYSGSIRMIDASGAFREQGGRRGRKTFDEGLLKEQLASVSREVATSEIIANGYNLLPKRYLLKLDDSIESMRLDELCDIHGPIRINEEIKKEYGGLVSLKGFSINFPTSSLRKEPANYRNELNSGIIIDRPTLFIQRSLRSSATLSIGYVDNKTGLPFVCGGDFHFAVSVKFPGITYQYLMLQLQSEFVSKQVLSFGMGANAVARMSLEDFRSLRIPMVSLPEQERLVLNAVEGTLSDVEKKRAKEAELYRAGVHTRKHALEQTVSALSSRWNKLANFFRNPKGAPSHAETLKEVLGFVIPGVNKLSVAEQIDAIDNLIKLTAQQVENLAEAKVKVKDIDTFSPVQLIVDYIRRFQSNLYLPVVEFADMERKDDTITFPIPVLEQILNNIISNAVEYGFHNTETPGNKICFRCFREDGNVIIEVANNGDPLKDGVEADSIFIPNFSTLLNTRGHSGTGATEVRSLMEQFGGSVEAYSTPKEEYTFTYRLIFEDNN